MPMPDKNENKEPLVFYSVIYRKYDSMSELHGKLYHVRYAYLEEDTYGRRVVDDICDGVDTRWVYHISKRGLKWKKVKEGKVVQRSVSEGKGYGVVTIGSDGSIVSNTVFDDQHQWVHNYYYMNDNLLNMRMRCIFWSMIRRAVNTRNRNCMLAQPPQVPQYKVW